MFKIIVLNFLQVPWYRIPGALRQIDSGCSREVWGVNLRQQVFRLQRNQRSWRRIKGRRLIHVTSGGSGVWAINARGFIYYREGKFDIVFADFSSVRLVFKRLVPVG